MNNYFKLLLYLKTHEGDGKEHPVEHLFPETTISEIKAILEELSDEGFIKFSGRETQYYSFMLQQNLLTGESTVTESPMNDVIMNTPKQPFKAKITFKGSKYLKEEIQMQDSGKYNIAVTGSGATNNFVIESQHVNINNKSGFNKCIEQIIETLKNDSSIDNELKTKAIHDFNLANSESTSQGKISEGMLKKILEYGSAISSIGQLVLGLLAG